MARRIEVVEYDPAWTRIFKAEAKEIKKILGKNCVAVYHIGSTSVKGLAAKPVIDMMPVVKDIGAVDALDERFEALGYECCGEFGIPGRRFYRKGGDQRTHHIHVFAQSSKEDIQRHLALRDYLRSHPAEAKEYEALKRRLAEEFRYDNDGYCDGKDAFVKQMEQKAMAWQKEQSRVGGGMAMGMCFGMCVGMMIGTAMGNTALGMCMGLSVGMCLGLALGSQKK